MTLANVTVEQKARRLESKVAENASTMDQLRQERSVLIQDHKSLQKRYSEISEVSYTFYPFPTHFSCDSSILRSSSTSCGKNTPPHKPHTKPDVNNSTTKSSKSKTSAKPSKPPLPPPPPSKPNSSLSHPKTLMLHVPSIN